MREIVFDTETTGFEPNDGHRIVEIGCVELIDHFPTGKSFQAYLNPERDVPLESQRVHGLSDDFLRDKPVFAAVAEEFLAFIGDAPLVIHNASFDIKFINAELARTGHPAIPLARAIDTIEIAKRKVPGARYSLDELCKRFGVDLTARTKHGALLDADLTAQIYLELIGGRQRGLALAPVEIVAAQIEPDMARAKARPSSLPPRLSEEEIALHTAFVAKELGDNAIWNQA
jgi:DNA polymerase-3 subunit epsilon